MHNILLLGPKIDVVNSKSYGGGTGGYTRNMSVYLSFFKFKNFKIKPCFHTVNGEINIGVFTKPYRLLLDMFYFTNSICQWGSLLPGLSTQPIPAEIFVAHVWVGGKCPEQFSHHFRQF